MSSEKEEIGDSACSHVTVAVIPVIDGQLCEESEMEGKEERREEEEKKWIRKEESELMSVSASGEEGSTVSRCRAPSAPVISTNNGGVKEGTSRQVQSRSVTPSSLAVTLQVPTCVRSTVNVSPHVSYDVIFSQDSTVIERYRQLATAVFGLMKSFSTSDITVESDGSCGATLLRSSASEACVNQGVGGRFRGGLPAPSDLRMMDSDIYSPMPLDATCRSVSTRAVIGDAASTSQIASPINHTAESIVSSIAPSLSPMYFVRSVNKRVRRIYIKKRIASTYRALERMSRSQLDLTSCGMSCERVTPVTRWNGLSTSSSTLSMTGYAAAVAAAAATATGAPVTRQSIASIAITNADSGRCDHGTTPPMSPRDHDTSPFEPSFPKCASSKLSSYNLFGEAIASLSASDIDSQKGKPVSKYDRNIIIFNWLQELTEPPIPDQFLSP